MGLGKKGMMGWGVVVMVVGFFTASTVEARIHPDTLLGEVFGKGEKPNYYIKSTTTACCNNCECTTDDSGSPQCQCTDYGETCHSACKTCRCVPLPVYPQLCICLDTTSSCYEACPSAAKPS